MHKPERKFMDAAIEEAIKSRESGDYAIGAVVIKNDEIIARAGNEIKIKNDATNHAEIVAIRKASEILNNRHLEGCILYTTHEPCPMCAATAIWARMEGIVFGARKDDMTRYGKTNGNKNLSWRTINVKCSEILERGNPHLFLVEDFMREECINLFHSD